MAAKSKEPLPLKGAEIDLRDEEGEPSQKLHIEEWNEEIRFDQVHEKGKVGMNDELEAMDAGKPVTQEGNLLVAGAKSEPEKEN